MQTITKEELVARLFEIKAKGWIQSARPGNAGGVGNTLEDLLGIKENNLPIANSGEWELKSQRSTTSSLVTLIHSEPSPTALRFVPSILLPKYGWPHQKAGVKYPPGEMSFRQTISGKVRSDRGFTVVVNRSARRVEISFDARSVASKHEEWLAHVAKMAGLGELAPQPYWGFSDLQHRVGTKLLNAFHVLAEAKKVNGIEYFLYSRFFMLREFSLDHLLTGIEQGYVYVDFDSRTGHNHGTKFRLRQDKLSAMYKYADEIHPGMPIPMSDAVSEIFVSSQDVSE